MKKCTCQIFFETVGSVITEEKINTSDWNKELFSCEKCGNKFIENKFPDSGIKAVCIEGPFVKNTSDEEKETLDRIDRMTKYNMIIRK